MGRGRGKGYHNIVGRDPMVHSQSARGIKQPQRLSPMVTKRALRKYKKGEYSQFHHGVHAESVFRVGDLILKFQDKAKCEHDQDVRRRCRAINLLHKKFPYYPEAQVVTTKDKQILITEYEGNTIGKSIRLLDDDKKDQLADQLIFLMTKGMANEDLNENNLVIDKDGNIVMIDLGMTEKIERNIYKPKTKESDRQFFDDYMYFSVYEVTSNLGLGRNRKRRAKMIQAFMKKHPKYDLSDDYFIKDDVEFKHILETNENYKKYLDETEGKRYKIIKNSEKNSQKTYPLHTFFPISDYELREILGERKYNQKFSGFDKSRRDAYYQDRINIDNQLQMKIHFTNAEMQNIIKTIAEGDTK